MGSSQERPDGRGITLQLRGTWPGTREPGRAGVDWLVPPLDQAVDVQLEGRAIQQVVQDLLGHCLDRGRGVGLEGGGHDVAVEHHVQVLIGGHPQHDLVGYRVVGIPAGVAVGDPGANSWNAA